MAWLLRSVLALYLCFYLSEASDESDDLITYDRYTGKVADESLLANYEELGVTDNCTAKIKKCTTRPEIRPIDGSCYNPKEPAKGTYLTPMSRILPAEFYNGTESRLSKSGKQLRNEREVRLALVPVSDNEHPLFNQNIISFAGYMVQDTVSIHDAENNLVTTTYCCEAAHLSDPKCASFYYPSNDPFEPNMCMNQTKPLMYQDTKCTNDSVPSPIVKATQAYDLDLLYNAFNDGGNTSRAFEGGLLSESIVNGMAFPPNGSRSLCPLNVASQNESWCFNNHKSAISPFTIYTIWFLRHHNYLAGQLAAVNPCWDDETIFQETRKLHIALTMQVFLYENLVNLIGKENAIKFGAISDCLGYRDIYDSNSVPTVTAEISLGWRFFHLMQTGKLRYYDEDGNYNGYHNISTLSFRHGHFVQGTHMMNYTYAMMYQPSHARDGTIDYEMANNGFAVLQRAVDALAGDLHKTRLVGLAPYIRYLEVLFGAKISNWDDLVKQGFMIQEAVDRYKTVYEDVADIDLMSGMWLENDIEGGYIPATLAYILSDAIRKSVISDPYWYERKTSFTIGQLKEIRKMTLARFLCNSAYITKVQKNAFVLPKSWNPVVSCSEIPQLDFSVWADSTCSSSTSS